MKPVALVVGAGGQLGQATCAGASTTFDIVGVRRAELDVTDAARVAAVVDSIRPAVIINCSAYNNVDGAEDDPVSALNVNAVGVKNLARAAAAAGATFVHYSTDFVFDGRTDRPYVETDEPNPRGAYGLSKLLGEWLAADAPSHYVLRVESLFGGAKTRSSIDRILDRLRQGETVRAFADRTVSPSFVEDVVRATLMLLERRAPVGLYHCVNSGWTTWDRLARELAELIGRPDAPIEGVPMTSAQLRADRPRFAALSNQKLRDAGIEMPSWEDAVARYVRYLARGL
jgi:dTDP-4-dehydrorhamnose reductase